MNKKVIIVVSAVCLIIFITLLVQNKQLKSENADMTEQIKTMQQLKDKSENADTTEVYIKARDTAKEFINSYFAYEDKPNKDQVLFYLTDNVKNKLSFQDEAGSGGETFSKIIADVKDLELFYGENKEDQQEIFARFTSSIELDDNKSYSPSFVKLDMIKTNDGWKVEDIEFMQY